MSEYSNAKVRSLLNSRRETTGIGNNSVDLIYKILTMLTQMFFDHKITNLHQSANDTLVTAMVETPTGAKTFSAQYLAGCDGGRSTVRKLLDMTYDGFTLPQWLVACNVRYPFQEYGFTRAQFVVHPEHFCLIGRIDPTGLWRVSYAEKDHLTREEVMANVHTKFEALFPGPKPLSKADYEVEMISPYRIHQRSAPAYRKGRSFLAGDAAHACAPFGGNSSLRSLEVAISAAADSFHSRDGLNYWYMRCGWLSGYFSWRASTYRFREQQTP